MRGVSVMRYVCGQCEATWRADPRDPAPCWLCGTSGKPDGAYIPHGYRFIPSESNAEPLRL